MTAQPQPHADPPAYNLIGRHVTIRGGFEDGLTGTIVANEPTPAQAGPNAFYIEARPYRFRVVLDGDPTASIGGLHPFAIDPDPCRYCGAGSCQGSASTARGADVERFEALHRAMHDHALLLRRKLARVGDALA